MVGVNFPPFENDQSENIFTEFLISEPERVFSETNRFTVCLPLFRFGVFRSISEDFDEYYRFTGRRRRFSRSGFRRSRTLRGSRFQF